MRILLLLIILHFSLFTASAQVNIWEGTSCKEKVMLTPYLAQDSGNLAIIVCPGGSYFWHDTKTEGDGVARWLQQQGISAFVLDYRTADVPAFIFHYRKVFRGNRYPDAQDDMLQAIRYVKNHALEYGVDADKIGVMGFSAGGHLAMSAAEFFSTEDRPRFVVPVYPVVTMMEDCVHKRSRRGLLGDSRTGNKVLREQLSLERHVPADCPPVFLVNCIDDPIVDYRNAVLLDSALTAMNVPHLYFQYQTGGHGFGVSEDKGSKECRQWKERFLEWLHTLL
ncbi:MAG: alpha/beta hydrolase [Prevotella sp.]|nr:alpha/beta hydrolase [Prevotella sp.]